MFVGMTGGILAFLLSPSVIEPLFNTLLSLPSLSPSLPSSRRCRRRSSFVIFRVYNKQRHLKFDAISNFPKDAISNFPKDAISNFPKDAISLFIIYSSINPFHLISM
ncbi:hypothetical protein NE237_023976 [Protea cynaroides]|uniref:Uncharacterized protein n=1 Tax=Protea cynaroides TaxID=273540 RepID=A0A9Q0K5X2_9MAGN|nr:hypothetical protein NE237_023976 [Protea cynaroides]